MSSITSTFDNVNAFFNRAADRLDMDEGIRELLRTPWREIKVAIPVEMAILDKEKQSDVVLSSDLLSVPLNVLVVDDGSTDQSVDIIKQYPVNLIQVEINLQDYILKI